MTREMIAQMGIDGRAPARLSDFEVTAKCARGDRPRASLIGIGMKALGRQERGLGIDLDQSSPTGRRKRRGGARSSASRNAEAANLAWRLPLRRNNRARPR